MQTTITLVDDHKIVRDGIKAMLAGHPRFCIVAEANNAAEFYHSLTTNVPDVVVLDIKMPDENGLEVAEKIKRDKRSIKILILTAEVDEMIMRQVIRIGIEGIISKESGREIYLEALEILATGKTYYSGQFVGLLNQHVVSNEKKLSNREVDVLKGFAQGLSYKEIAARLNISPRTVETHKLHLLEKLKLQSTTDLVKYAIKQGFTQL